MVAGFYNKEALVLNEDSFRTNFFNGGEDEVIQQLVLTLTNEHDWILQLAPEKGTIYTVSTVHVHNKYTYHTYICLFSIS